MAVCKSSERDLAIIFDVSEVLRLPSGIRVLSLDADSWSVLKQRGCDVITPSNVLGDAGLLALSDEVKACHRFWRKHASIIEDGVNVFDLVAYRHLRWICRFTYVASVVRCAVTTMSATRVHLCDTPGGHGLDRPAMGRRMTALHALAEGIAVELGAEVITHGSAKTAEKVVGKREWISPANDVYRSGHVLCIADAVERAAASSIMAHVHQRGMDVACIHHASSQAPDSGDDGGVQWVNECAYAGVRREVRFAECGSARACFSDEARQSCDSIVRSVFGSPGVTDHLDFLFGEYARLMAGHLERWRRALLRHRPSAVVAMYPCVAIDVAALLGIPALLLPHGPMMFGELEYYELLHPGIQIGCVGRVHQAILERHNLDSRRLMVSGVSGGTRLTASRAGTPHILLPTSEAMHPATIGGLPTTIWEREAEALGEVVRECTIRGWGIELRPHPRYDRTRAFYEALVGEHKHGVRIVTGAECSLASAVERSSAAVFVGAPSGAMPVVASAMPIFLLTSAWLGVAARDERSAMPEVFAKWGLQNMPRCATVPKLMHRMDSMFASSEQYMSEVRKSAEASEALLASIPDDEVAGWIIHMAHQENVSKV